VVHLSEHHTSRGTKQHADGWDANSKAWAHMASDDLENHQHMVSDDLDTAWSELY
jgi:hypothetical protein